MFKKGDLVECSMNGEDWFSGTYHGSSEILAEHGVFVSEFDEVRYFIKCRMAAQKNGETEPSTSHNKQSESFILILEDHVPVKLVDSMDKFRNHNGGGKEVTWLEFVVE